MVPPHPYPGVLGRPVPATHIVFVPVDGRIVFTVCGLLVVACLLWLALLRGRGE